MEKVRIFPNGLEQYEARLGLGWPVSYWLVEGETCRCVCDGLARMHEVWINGHTAQDPERGLPDIVHELCHCHLAERVDPAFSTAYFTEKWNGVSRNEPEKYQLAAQQLYYAWCHVDIWVNELMGRKFSELVRESHQSFARAFTFLLAQEDWSFLQSPESLLGLAQYQAERRRFGLTKTPDLFVILRERGIEVDPRIRRLARYFQGLPKLGSGRKKDLKALEISVQEVAKTLFFSIKPRLVFEERWVWDLG
jgi:hypothetical protein